MPLFLSEEEFALVAHDASAVAERADAAIRDLRRQLDTVGAEADAASIAAEQTFALLEQRYATLSLDLDRVKSDNEQLSGENERHASHLAEVQAEKHQLYLKAIAKDGEFERLNAELAELQKSRRQLLELVEQKDAEIRERNTTVQSFLDKIMSLTESTAAKETRFREIEMELNRCHATCNRITQEKELLEKHNGWLDEELKAKTSTLAEIRRNNMDIESQMSARIADLEREMNESSANLNRRNERVSELEERVSYLEKELSSTKEAAGTNEQQLNAELSTVSKLVELYKESSSEWSKKAGELEGVIKALETHLSQVENDYKEKLEKEVSIRQELEKAAAEMREKLDKCEAELENTRKSNEMSLSFPSNSSMNELVLAEAGVSNREDGNEQMIVPSVPRGISGTALAASLIRDGWSLAKMYEKYQEADDALRHERWGRRHAEAVLERILREIEQKAELILDERAEHERMVESYTLLSQKLEQAALEHENFENIIRNLKCELRRRERDHNVEERTIDDLQKQIAVLLKECQDIQIRCGVSSISTSFMDENELTGHMNFKDIRGLVEQNAELRSQIQSLSAELERRDEELKEGFQIEMQKLNDEAVSKVEAVLKRSEEQGRMIESLHTSVAMYKRLYEEELRSRSNGDALPKGPSEERSGGTVLRIEEGSQQGVSKEEHDRLVERARKLEQDLTALSDEVSKLKLERDRLALEAEFSKEHLNSSKLELEHQKKEANAVLTRNVEMTQLTIEYQKRLRESSDFVQASEEKLRNLSMEVSVLKHEKEILASSEKHCMEEARNLSDKVHRLQSSLDTIQTTEEIRENSRAFEKRKQEEHVKQLEQEWAQSKKELQEEKDHVMSLTLEKKITVENYIRQVEELKKELSDARQALSSAESRAAVAEAKCSDLEMRATRKGAREGSSSMDISEVNNDDALKMKEELNKAREEAQVNKTYMQEYKDIAHTTEAALKQMESAHEDYKAKAETSKRASEEEIASLRTKVSELQKMYESKCQEAASLIEEKEKELFLGRLEVSVLKDEISEKTAQVETLQLQVSSLKDVLDMEHKRWRTAQDNYERQVILQSETIQELTTTSKELSTLQSEISKLREILDTQKAENERLTASWEHEKLELHRQRDEALKNYNETNEQNKILHNRLEALHVRLADKEMTSAGYSVDSKKESDVQNVITYLRRSKEIAETEISLLKKEKMRLQSELEMVQKSSEEAQALLRTRAESAKATVLKDEDFKSLQLQVREVSLLRESNIQLREENKYNFEECQKRCEEARKAKTEAESSRNILLTKQIDLEACQKELEMRKAEVENLNARITELVENNKKVDPKEHEQVKNELQQIKALMRDNVNELEQTKNLISEKEKLVEKLEGNFAKCQAELSDRDSKLAAIIQAEAGLKTEIERLKKVNQTYTHTRLLQRKTDMQLVKEKDEISREKESLLKEKENLSKERESLSREKESLSKEKEGFLKQIEELKSSKKSAGESSLEQAVREKETRIQMLERTLEKERSDKDKDRNEKAKRQKHEQVITTLVDNTKMEKQKVDEKLAEHRKNIAKLLEGTRMTASQIPSLDALEKQNLEYFTSLNNLESSLASSTQQEGQTSSSIIRETTPEPPFITPARQATPPRSEQPSIPPARQATPPRPPIRSLASSQAKATEKRTKPIEVRKSARRIVRPALGSTSTTTITTTNTDQEQPQPDTDMLTTPELPTKTEDPKIPPAGKPEVAPPVAPEIVPAAAPEIPPAAAPEIPPAVASEIPLAGASEIPAAGTLEITPAGVPEIPPAGTPESRKRALSSEPKEKEESGAQEDVAGAPAAPPLKKQKEDIVNVVPAIVEQPQSAEIPAGSTLEPALDDAPTIVIEEMEAVPTFEEILEEMKEEDVNMITTNEEMEPEEEEEELEPEEEEQEEQPVETDTGAVPEEGEAVLSEGEIEGDEDDREEGELTGDEPEQQLDETEVTNRESTPSPNDETAEMLEADDLAKGGNDEIEKGEIIEDEKLGDDTETGDDVIAKPIEEDTSSSVVATPEVGKTPPRVVRLLRARTPAITSESAQGSTTTTATGTEASGGAGGTTIILNERAKRNAALRQAGISSQSPSPSRGRGRPAGTTRTVGRGRARGGRGGLRE